MCLYRRSLNDLKPHRFVVTCRLQFAIGYGNRPTADLVADPEPMLGLGCLANTDQKLSLLTTDLSLEAQRITQVGVVTLVKGTCQPDTRLYSDHRALPGNLVLVHCELLPFCRCQVRGSIF